MATTESMIAKLWNSSAQEVWGRSSSARIGPVGWGPFVGLGDMIQTFARASNVGWTKRVAMAPKTPPRMARPMVSHL